MWSDTNWVKRITTLCHVPNAVDVVVVPHKLLPFSDRVECSTDIVFWFCFQVLTICNHRCSYSYCVLRLLWSWWWTELLDRTLTTSTPIDHRNCFGKTHQGWSFMQSFHVFQVSWYPQCDIHFFEQIRCLWCEEEPAPFRGNHQKDTIVPYLIISFNIIWYLSDNSLWLSVVKGGHCSRPLSRCWVSTVDLFAGGGRRCRDERCFMTLSWLLICFVTVGGWARTIVWKSWDTNRCMFWGCSYCSNKGYPFNRQCNPHKLSVIDQVTALLTTRHYVYPRCLILCNLTTGSHWCTSNITIMIVVKCAQ